MHLHKHTPVVCSPVYFGSFVVEDYLGKIRRDSDGNIVGAEATTMTWFLEVDGDEVTDLPSVSDAVCVHV